MVIPNSEMIINKDQEARKRALDKEREALASEKMNKNKEVETAENTSDVDQWHKEFENKSKFWKGVPPETLEKAKEAQNRALGAKGNQNKTVEKTTEVNIDNKNQFQKPLNKNDGLDKTQAQGRIDLGKKIENKGTDKLKDLNENNTDSKIKHDKTEIKKDPDEKVDLEKVGGPASVKVENVHTENKIEKGSFLNKTVLVMERTNKSETIEWTKEFETRAKFWKTVPTDTENVVEKVTAKTPVTDKHEEVNNEKLRKTDIKSYEVDVIESDKSANNDRVNNATDIVHNLKNNKEFNEGNKVDPKNVKETVALDEVGSVAKIIEKLHMNKSTEIETVKETHKPSPEITKIAHNYEILTKRALNDQNNTEKEKVLVKQNTAVVAKDIEKDKRDQQVTDNVAVIQKTSPEVAKLTQNYENKTEMAHNDKTITDKVPIVRTTSTENSKPVKEIDKGIPEVAKIAQNYEMIMGKAQNDKSVVENGLVYKHETLKDNSNNNTPKDFVSVHKDKPTTENTDINQLNEPKTNQEETKTIVHPKIIITDSNEMVSERVQNRGYTEKDSYFSDIFIEEPEIDIAEWNREFKTRATFWKERDKQHEQEKKALSAELEAERQSRQKLLSSQYELQERLDSLQKAPVTKEHRRSLSDASTNSQQETTVEDDYGYGSVRSVETSRPALEAVNWSAGTHGPQNGPAPIADAGLVLRMQNRMSALQGELSRTSKRAYDLEERLMNRMSSPQTNPGTDRFKVEELEIENKKLKEHLERLRAAGDSEKLSQEVIEQLSVMQNELDRRRDEIIQLKSVLSNQTPWFQALKNVTVNLKSLASSNYGSDVDIINEDGELATAYEAQKGINRQLQEELLAEKKFYSEHITKTKTEIERLREENEKYQKILSAELSEQPKNKSQEFAQNEIIRLAAESLALQERVDKLSESCRRYKNQIRLLVQKLKDVGIEDVNDILESNDSIVPTNASMTQDMAPVTRKKEREYLGMFEYKIQDEATIIKKLITDLKPKIAVSLLPGLPAYILFMMLRHMDHVDDEPKMHQLMKAVRTGVKKTLKKRGDNIEYNCLWLANMLRLLNNLRQYSGDAVYQSANTPRQNQQCLRIFDLSEYRQVLSDIAVWIYQGLIHLLERQLERLIVPAILEHEEISGLSGPGARAAAGAAPGPARLKQELGAAHAALHAHAVHQPLRAAIFKQLFYYICAYSLNQLLLRKDLCCWAKGLQIRYNISHLETWIKEHLAEYGQKSVEEILCVLRPITQAVQLLQARKSMQDVQSTVDMCSSLTAMQVCKILNMYTPAEEYEVKVTREFIHEIQKKMQEKAGTNADKEPQNLLMDSKMIFSVQFPFNPSPIRLEAVELPDVLELDGLLTKI